MGANGTGGRPFGYRFFRGPCPRCKKSCALTFTDAGWIWFRKHKPCGTFRVPRVDYELKQQKEKKPIDEVREKLANGQEKLSQDETSALVDQYMIDSFEASDKKAQKR